MSRHRISGAFALGLCCLAAAPIARAESLFNLSGQVKLADGVAADGTLVKLQLDLDRNGDLDSFETLTATVNSDGSYQLNYDLDPGDVDLEFLQFATELVADYNARGFEALLDDGPLPVLLSFEREGYSTVVKRLSSMFETPNFDVVLAPLRDVHCADATCLSPDGGVRISGFPGGTRIARAYADAYDPSQDTTRFPGLFTDSTQNLLISSGFAEINLYDESGKAIHELSSPVAVRFEAKRPSWKTMPDLESESGRIELPMYSFDQSIGEWVREGDGELQYADGSLVEEESLSSIRDGSFTKDVFVSFETSHFSTFNCDAPVQERACVKGRLVTSVGGEALAGVQVSLDGVSYTGSAGAVFTGLDGYFATDVMKSELAGEDVDTNGKTGETFSARLTAGAAAGVYVGATFDTPTIVGSVEVGTSKSCRPELCDCVDLGDIVTDFEPPRLCEVTIQGTFSGSTVIGDSGPIAKGEAVVGADVRGSLAGSTTLPQAAVAAICEGTTCSPGVLDESGSVTFSVPVIGDAPELRLDADFSLEQDGKLHYYTGSVVVTGCAVGEEALAEPVLLALDHASVGDLGSFIDSLGAGPIVSGGGGTGGSSGNPFTPPEPQDPLGGSGCGCRAAPARTTPSALFAAALALAFGVSRRRRARP